jgi:hypothetical protein
MWPFGKKVKQPEARIEKEKLRQDIKGFESPAKKPEPPKEINWECPICIKAIPERTTRSRFKCPHCRNWVYFLGDNLVTMEDHERLAEKYYQDRHSERLRETMTEELAKIGLTKERLKWREQELLAKMGVQPQKISVILSLFSETILKVKGLYEKWDRYISLADILHKGGEDSFPVLQVAAKTKLAALKKEGYRNVSIIAGGTCPACEKLDGKVISIDQALKTMPIPIRTCKNRSKDEKYAFCNCQYLGKVDDEYMMNMK